MTNLGDKLFKSFAAWAAYLTLTIIFSIFLVIMTRSGMAIDHFGFDFFGSYSYEDDSGDTFYWDPREDEEEGIFPKISGLPAIYGTLMSAFIAIIIATPLALGVAFFVSEIIKGIARQIVVTMIELLAAIPSIMYGMWGLFTFSNTIFSGLDGIMNISAPTNIFVAGCVLSIMILPFITTVVKDAILSTPSILKESAYALGCTRFEVLKDIVVPYTKTAIVGSIIIALGRALGETMAVVFIIGNAHNIGSIFDQGTTISTVLANEFPEANADDAPIFTSSLFYLAFILFIISLSTIILGKFIFLNKERRVKKR